MNRHLNALIVVTVAALVFGAASASATPRTPVRPDQVFQADGVTPTPEFWQMLQNPTLYPPPAEGVPGADIQAVMQDARARSGIIPRTREFLTSGSATKLTLGSIAIALFGQYAVSGYGDLYDAIKCWGPCTDTAGTATVSGTIYTMTPSQWVYVEQYFDVTQGDTTSRGTDANCDGTAGGATGGECAPQTGWYLTAKCATNTGFGCHLPGTYITNAFTFNEVSALASVPAVTAVPGSGPQADNNCGVSGPPHTGESCVNAFTWFATDDVMQASLKRTPATQAQCVAAGSSCVTVNNFNQTLDPTGVHPAFGDPGSQTPAQAATEDSVNGNGATTSPTTAFLPFVIPKPDPSQTYQDYIDLLRAKGWLGQVTVDTVTTDEPTVGPDGVVSVENTAQGTGPNAVIAWPANPLQIKTPTDTLTIRKNSNSAPPIAPAGGIDLTPLTGISFGCKFPFGLFCYASDVTGWFDVTPVTPEFNFTIPGFNVGGTAIGPDHAYNVSLSGMDSYMATIRSIIAIALWVGAGWLLASRILGLQLGDPGAAVDDGLPL